MLHTVKSRALGKHPACEDAFLGAIELCFVDFDERRRDGLFRERARIADARRYRQRAEFHGFVNRDFQWRYVSRYLVQRGKHSDLVLDLLRLGSRREQRNKHQAGQRDPYQHSSVVSYPFKLASH
jgi:hypothetical protein